MTIFLLLIPLLAIVSSLFLYRYTGKKELLRLDIVQFFYIFILAPFLYLWLKSFVNIVLQQEWGWQLSATQATLLDSILSVLFLYVFAFVVIHGLTKTFSLKIHKDPLYDVFAHAEYFHLDISHLVVNGSVLIFLTLLSMFNLLVPVTIDLPRSGLYQVLGFGIVASTLMFITTWMYNSPAQLYMRIMKVGFGLGFLIHLLLYYLYPIEFSLQYGMYWFSGAFFTGLVALSLVAEKKDQAPKKWWNRKLPFQFTLGKWKYYQSYLRKKGWRGIFKLFSTQP